MKTEFLSETLVKRSLARRKRRRYSLYYSDDPAMDTIDELK